MILIFGQKHGDKHRFNGFQLGAVKNQVSLLIVKLNIKIKQTFMSCQRVVKVGQFYQLDLDCDMGQDNFTKIDNRHCQNNEFFPDLFPSYN